MKESKTVTNPQNPAENLEMWTSPVFAPSIACLLLGCITFAVYLPVMGFDFVAFDDFDYVTSNRHVQRGLTWDGMQWAFQAGHSSNWHPLTWLSLMLDVNLWHNRAGGFHLTNLLLHTINTVLLFIFLRRATGNDWRSGLVAGLFALHPLHVESVAWIAERKDMLNTFFGFLSLIFYTGYAQSKIYRSPSVIRNYCLALVCFALGLMSKPMLVTLPFVMLLLDFWPLGRNSSCGRLVIEKIPFFVLSAASSVVTFLVQQHGGAVQSHDNFPIGGRIGNALVAYAGYLEKTFWPTELAFLYPHPGHWPLLTVVAAAALVFVLSVLALRLKGRLPFVPVGWFWFLGTLVPVIGFVQVGLQARADRYTYLPLIGVFIIVAWALGELIVRWNLPKWTGKCAGFVILWACAVRTADQLEHWRNSETLFRHALVVTGKNYVAHNDLGYYLFNQGRADEALEQYHEALKIKPDYADALNNLGYALAKKGRHEEAMTYYEAALRANPGQVEARNNLGIALDEFGRLDEAIEQYRQALELNPDHANAHGNLGIALAKQGKLDEAVVHFRAAIRLNPDAATTHNNLGGALAMQQHFSEAVGEYAIALRLRPDYAEAHKNLGFALAAMNRREEAIGHLKEALRLVPDYAAARQKLKELDAE